MGDAERRIRDEVTHVLDTYQVQYELIQKSRHPAVAFHVNGRRVVFPLSGSGDPRAHHNARSQIRQILVSAGATVPPLPPPRIELPEELIEDDQPVLSDTEVQQILDSSVRTEDEQPYVEPEPEVVAMAGKTLNADSYSLYAPKLKANNCIVIELGRDLMVQKGGLLVIPLDRPNTVIDVSRELFDTMFTLVPDEPLPVPKPIEVPVPVQEVRKPPEPETFEARSIDDVIERIVDREPEGPQVRHYAEGESGLRPKKRPTPPPKKAKSGRAVNYVNTPYRERMPRSIEGVSPQAARMLACMAYVTDTQRRVDLAPRHFNDMMLDHDRKQVATRMPKLVQLGLVEYGLPIPDSRGYHVKLTGKARRLLTKMGSWPWLYDGLDVPRWAQ
jgi:hypothetical protein